MKIKATALVILVASMIGVSGTAYAQDPPAQTKPAVTYKGPKKRIAVVPIDASTVPQSSVDEFAQIYKSQNNIHTPSDVGNRLTEMLTTALDNTGRFVLLEREAIGDIKNEIAVTAELGNEQTAVKKGNLLGAQMLVKAAVTEFAPNRTHGGGGITLGGISVGGGGSDATVTLDLRFIDPSTSQILYTAKAEGKSSSRGGSLGFSVGSLGVQGGGGENQPIERATRDAIEKAVKIVIDKMAPLPWEAKVADFSDDGTVLLNRGSNDGLKVGDVLKVFKPGKVVKDPDTGEVLGRDQDTLVGTATITWVNDRLSKASFAGAGADKPQTGFLVKLDYNDK
jgi:curli biogenesis system outer membrane secretion channel CsgG